MKRYIIRVAGLLLIAATLLQFGGCTREMLEPSLKQSKDFEQKLDFDYLNATVQGAYNVMSDVPYYGRDYIIYGEILGDNCVANGSSNRFTNVASGDMYATDGYAADTWFTIYKVIAQANVAILRASEVQEHIAERDHRVGEAYAIRALAHFDLLKLYGAMHVTGSTPGIPYVREFTNDLEKIKTPRSNPKEVQQYLYEDLDKAISMMNPNETYNAYLTTWGAYAIKARVALYFGDWETASTAAKKVIDAGKYRIISKEEYVASWIRKDGPNRIFQMVYNPSDNLGINGLTNIYNGRAYGDISATMELKGCFEAEDVRGSDVMIGLNRGLMGTKPYIGYFMANLGKYPDYVSLLDNIPLIRYEEVILTYGEAEMNKGNTAEALTYINMIAEARGATAYTEATPDNFLLERRRELCFEGFRFFDMSRHKKDVPSIAYGRIGNRPKKYGDHLYAFPIPMQEVISNPNIKQNPGY